jgi:hypothetical protein
MAQGAVAMAPALNGTSLTAEELREILEYDKIIQFRDSVFAGTHPRIKIPPNLLGKQNSAGRNISSPSSSIPRTNMSTQLPHSSPSFRNEDSSSSFFNKSSYQRFGGAATMASNTEINPVLLEKSADLVKAEIQLQRQKLERGLREQIEKQRIEAKALLQTSESLPNFDLSEVLSKALQIVHPSTATEADPSVGARSSASDSFDENTFYSSQHETPIPSPQVLKEPVVLHSNSRVPVNERVAEIDSTQTQVEDREVFMTGTSLLNNNNSAAPLHQSQPRLQSTKGSATLHGSGVETINSDSSSFHEVTADADVDVDVGTLDANMPGKVSPPQLRSRISIYTPFPESIELYANAE